MKHMKRSIAIVVIIGIAVLATGCAKCSSLRECAATIGPCMHGFKTGKACEEEIERWAKWEKTQFQQVPDEFRSKSVDIVCRDKIIHESATSTTVRSTCRIQ